MQKYIEKYKIYIKFVELYIFAGLSQMQHHPES